MKRALEEGGIPDELYDKKGSHCDNATMTNILFCDLSIIMRHPAAITGADIEQCYDRMAHSLTSIVL